MLQEQCSHAMKTIVDFVKSLQKRGTLTATQTDVIVQNLKGDELPMMMMHHNSHSILSSEQEKSLQEYFQRQQENGQMAEEVRRYLSTLLRFQKPTNMNNPLLRSGSIKQSYVVPEFSVNYDDESSNGVVEFVGHYCNHNYEDNPNFPHYRGIWGFSVESEEYALLTDVNGLHIINVTDAKMPTLVKFIELEHLMYERSVRDVDIYIDDTTNSVYAYVAAQNYYEVGRLHVINVTEILQLDDEDNDNFDEYVVNRGAMEYGHTVTIGNGLLLLNTANNAEEPGIFGCRLYDLVVDPWDPPLVGIYTAGECHDTSLHRLRVDDDEDRLVLISADGNDGRWRFIDVQLLIEDYQTWTQSNEISKRDSIFDEDEDDNYYESPRNVILGQTPPNPFFYEYAHSQALDEDTMLLYVFEENNEYDVSIYDLTTLNSPVLVKTLKQDLTRHDAVVHNGHLLKYVDRTYLAIAYYSAGFRVWDVTNIDDIQEVGHFDTIQNLDDNNIIDPDDVFNDLDEFYDNPWGAWNLYAGLPSGHLLVSDLQQGLYILKINTDDGDDDNDSETGDISGTTDLPLGSFCISGTMTVTLSNGQSKQVRDLKIGDMVQVSKNENAVLFEPIMMFGHYDSQITATYHHLILDDGDILEISEHHLIYVKRQQPPVPVSTLQVGQQLQCGRRIVKRTIRQRKGAYAPWTPSGMLMIQNQVLISAYVTLQPNQTYVSFLGLDWSYQFLAHSMTLPLRRSFFSTKRNNEDVAWLYDWVQRYWSQQPPCIMAVMFIVIILPLALLFHSLEQAIGLSTQNRLLLLLLGSATLWILSKRKKTKNKDQ